MNYIRRTKQAQSYLSAKDSRFLNTLELWLRDQSEILVIIRYSRAAGAKSFEFFSSFTDLAQRLIELPPSTNIIAFRQPQLALRGTVDEAFVEKCIASIPETAEFLLVETAPQAAGKVSRFHHEAGQSHQELRAALENSRGRAVAVGVYPRWNEESPDVISAVVPDDHGDVKRGVY